ncbi:MAG TPA: hypothetical protein VJH95_05950 [Candidatus Nanoarchaeia archaeon]|nr:hypothetical protein [Candidatus Nanoarchaeia archaeon]
MEKEKKDIGTIFYIISQVIAYILAVIIIYQILKILLGGSWETEQVILALVMLNLSISFGIGGYLLHLNNKISKVDSKLTGHFGWHKGRDEELKPIQTSSSQQ